MKFLVFLILLSSILLSEELKIKAQSFNTDENKGLSIFDGNVSIVKGVDEINASKIMIYTDKNKKPSKFIAFGNVSFYIKTEDNATYKGNAQKIIYLPIKKEYHFFTNVHLEQINTKKIILGEEVVLKTIDGQAYAKGAEKEPVIMIFDLPEKEEKK